MRTATTRTPQIVCLAKKAKRYYGKPNAKISGKKVGCDK